MDMSVTKNLNKQVYENAAELVLKGHVKYALARNAQGRRIMPEEKGAVAWCALGAIGKACQEVLGESVGFDYNFEHEPPSVTPHRQAFEGFIGDQICFWNNKLSSTPEQIASKFREFAATL